MSFHEYRINELYSNGDGTVQFIEMAVGDINSEGFWLGVRISVTQAGVTHAFIFPSSLPSQFTANTKVLIATQGFADLGIVVPDFIVPDNFLFSGTGNVNYANVDSFAYAELPSDGIKSLSRDGSIGPATPENFAGATSTLGEGSGITGTGRNDTLQSGAGRDIIDGLAGVDTVVFAGNRGNYTIDETGIGHSVVDNVGNGGNDLLINVERLQFDDRTVAVDIEGNAGQAYRLFPAAFDRAPDNDGLKYWIAQLDEGMPLEQVANGFIASDEFLALYGPILTVGAFVTNLYNNTLHRPPDPAGFQYWSNLLNTGTLSQAQVMISFSESAESQANVIGVIENGIELF